MIQEECRKSPVGLKAGCGVDASFPLTLTLSLGEREQRAQCFGFSVAALANPASGIFMRRETILPLPKGEGRGEGEGSVALPKIALAQRRGSDILAGPFCCNGR